MPINRLKDSKMFVTISNKASKAAYKLDKHAPTILTVVSGVTMLAAIGTACKQTTKINDILDKAKEDIDAVHEGLEHPEVLPEPYTKEDSIKDLALIYFQTAVKLFKLYRVPIFFTIVSLTSMGGSLKKSKKRIAGLTAYAATQEKHIKDVYEYIAKKYGDKAVEELRCGVVEEEVEETKKKKDGTEVTKTKKVKHIDPNKLSPYAVFYQQGCLGWTKDAQANKKFLLLQQNTLNSRLQARGYLTINEVYSALGIAEIADGMIVGWVYDEKNPVGDNFVDFGIFDQNDEVKRDFVNGDEPVILLDFNYDGDIHRIWSERRALDQKGFGNPFVNATNAVLG